MRAILRGISLRFLRGLRFTLRRPGLVVGLGLAITAVSVAAIPFLEIEPRIYDIVDPHFESTTVLRAMREDFKEKPALFLTIGMRDSALRLSPELYCRIVNWAEEQNFRNEALSGVFGPFSLVVPESRGKRLWYRPLIDSRCANTAAPEHFSLEPLHDSPWASVLTSNTLSDVGMELRFRERFDPVAVRDLQTSLHDRLLSRFPELHATWSGRAASQYFLKEALRQDAAINLLVLAAMLLFCRGFYGTWRSGAMLVGVVGITATWVYGMMSLTHCPVDLMANGLFLLLSLSAVEDFVFLSHRMAKAPEASWRPAFRAQITPGFFTSLTTMIGFASLESADLAIIKRFGAFAAFGALAEWVVLFILMPAVLRLLAVRRPWVSPRSRELWTQSLTRSLAGISAPRWTLPICALLLAGGVLGFFHLNTDDSPRSGYPKDHPSTVAYHYLRETRGWEGAIELLFTDSSTDASREAENREILAQVERDPNVSKVDDRSRYLEFVERNIPTALRPLVASELRGPGVYRNYVSESGHARAALYLKSIDLADLNATLSRLRALCGSRCEPAGESVVYADYTDRVVRSLVGSFLISLLLVGLVLIALCRASGVARFGAVLLSAFWCPTVMIGAMALFRVPLNFTTSIFASVLVGLTGDNAVQYLLASRRHGRGHGRSRGHSRGHRMIGALAEQGGATVQLAMLNAGGALLFTGLTLTALRQLGWLLSSGFVVGLFGDLWLLRGLLRGPLLEHEPKRQRD